MIPSTPSSATDLHVVIGAAGGTGAALVHELHRRGLAVRAVTRSGSAPDLPPGTQIVKADAANAASLRTAVAGAAIVYHAANVPYPRWVAELPGITAAIRDATADAGAKLVFADNLYAYGPTTGAMTEATGWDAGAMQGLESKFHLTCSCSSRSR